MENTRILRKVLIAALVLLVAFVGAVLAHQDEIENDQSSSTQDVAPAQSVSVNEKSQTQTHPDIKTLSARKDVSPIQTTPKERFPGAKLIVESENVDRFGTKTRVQILETHFKYPLVRAILQKSADGKSQLTYMVADRVIVKKTESSSETEFQHAIRSVGGVITASIPEEGMYLVGGIDGRDPHGILRMLRALKNAGSSVEYAEPDYIHSI